MSVAESAGSAERLPHADPAAERAVLGAVLHGAAWVLDEAAELLGPSAFYKPRHGELFAEMLIMRDAGRPVDPISLADHLGDRLSPLGGAPELHTLMQAVPTPSNVGYYAEIVADKAARRAVAAAGVRLVQLSYSTADPPEIVDRVRGDLDAIPTGPRKNTGPAGVLLRLADVQPQRLAWLWPGRLPAGKLVTLDGDPSLGKSTLALTFAAHVSTGKPWPDDQPCEIGDVVILSAEDGLADTIRPRLDAASGDPGRVHALTAVRTVDDDGTVTTRPPTLADVAAIRATIEQTASRLLVVDVLMAYMPGKVDSHRDQDVRAVLHRIAEMADDTGCTVLLLRHLNKTSGGSAMYRGGGSIGIVGAARAGYVVAADPDDAELRVLACLKSNLAAMPPSLSYRLESAPGSDVARVTWGGESIHDANRLLRPAGVDDDRDERDEVKAWLEDLLKKDGGTAEAGDVFQKAAHAGYSRDQVKRAKKRLGVTARKPSMAGGWMWIDPTKSDPEGGTKGAKGAPPVTPPPSLPSALPSECDPDPDLSLLVTPPPDLTP